MTKAREDAPTRFPKSKPRPSLLSQSHPISVVWGLVGPVQECAVKVVVPVGIQLLSWRRDQGRARGDRRCDPFLLLGLC